MLEGEKRGGGLGAQSIIALTSSGGRGASSLEPAADLHIMILRATATCNHYVVLYEQANTNLEMAISINCMQFVSYDT